jgi:hypothetical protein
VKIIKILITATAYPLPSISYDELVCVAGIDEHGKWYRLYPVPLKLVLGIKGTSSFKYSWVELEVKKRGKGDPRPESYSTIYNDISKIRILNKLDYSGNWRLRKEVILKNVYTDISLLIQESRPPKNKSIAVFKPSQIEDFIIEKDSRQWKDAWKNKRLQGDLFNKTEVESKIKKVPYKFFYKFKDNKNKPSKLMIEDWELGALYWNSLRRSKNDEVEALKKVRLKYFDEFVNKKDIYLFLGTTLEWHLRKAKNPFVIIGVFYPPKQSQEELVFT